jgi:anti-anti-sigma factor
MNFPVSWTDGLAVVTAPEEIDITNAEPLRAALSSVLSAGPAVIVVDMTHTQFCDSTGLNVLVRLNERMAGEGSQLRLAIGSAAVHRMLTVTGVGGVLCVYDSLGEALRPQ